MKKALLLLPLVCVAILYSFTLKSYKAGSQAINPIIGDISFIARFGHAPTETTDDNLRIRTHLEYAEKLLRSKDVSHLSPALREKRNGLLDLLKEYYQAGIFPGNYDYKTERRPCFIDKDGKICAVGYLVEQTAGRAAAVKINEAYKYDVLMDMDDTDLENWIANSGLTKEECAIIQPTYGPSPIYTRDYMPPGYAAGTAFASGVNMSLSAINLIQISNGSHHEGLAIASMVTGAGSVVYGVVGLKSDRWTLTESKKTLSALNIGLGTSTMILAAWNIAVNESKERKTSWNGFLYPAQNERLGIGLGFVRRL